MLAQATRNGGPVDIVHTLSNGILVEPTDVRAVSDALVQMVTSTELWQRYSDNGRNNIVAYSWPSHCLKMLQHVEGEKRRHKVRVPAARSALRMSLDDLTLSDIATEAVAAAASEATFGTSPGAGGGFGFTAMHHAGAPLQLAQATSAPPGALNPAALCIPARAALKSPPPETMGISPKTHPLILDDLAMNKLSRQSLPHPSAQRLHKTVRCASRRQWVVAAVDDFDMASRVAALLRRSADARKLLPSLPDPASPAVGFGLMTTHCYKDAITLLESCNCSLQQLDFLVCDAGAQIWHMTQGPARSGSSLAPGHAPAAEAANGGESPAPVFDEDWERHYDYKWDAPVVRQVLKRLIATKAFLGKAASRAPGVQVRLSGESTPYHYLVNIRGVQVDSVDADLLLARFRRLLRRNGLRSQLLLTADFKPSDQYCMTLHVTPLRAARHLALRYIAHHYKLPLEAFTLLTPATSVAGGKVVVTASDGQELLGGLQQVVITPTPTSTPACKFTHDISVWSSARVQLSPGQPQLDEAATEEPATAGPQ